jgi:hypothetical protein
VPPVCVGPACRRDSAERELGAVEHVHGLRAPTSRAARHTGTPLEPEALCRAPRRAFASRGARQSAVTRARARSSASRARCAARRSCSSATSGTSTRRAARRGAYSAGRRAATRTPEASAPSPTGTPTATNLTLVFWIPIAGPARRRPAISAPAVNERPFQLTAATPPPHQHWHGDRRPTRPRAPPPRAAARPPWPPAGGTAQCAPRLVGPAAGRGARQGGARLHARQRQRGVGGGPPALAVEVGRERQGEPTWPTIINDDARLSREMRGSRATSPPAGRPDLRGSPSAEPNRRCRAGGEHLSGERLQGRVQTRRPPRAASPVPSHQDHLPGCENESPYGERTAGAALSPRGVGLATAAARTPVSAGSGARA